MTKRILLAGFLGGLAMYVWSSIAHIVLPLGQTGISEIPNEAVLLGSMGSTLGERSGLYLFPGMGGNTDMKQYEAKLATSPSGLLIYQPPGNSGMTPARLITEFATEVAEAMLLAWLLAQSRMKTMGSRLLFSLVVGVAAAITTNVSYWNWYGFLVAHALLRAASRLISTLQTRMSAPRYWLIAIPRRIEFAG